MSENVRIVGIVLVRNEDLHLERVLRNTAAFCDAYGVTLEESVYLGGPEPRRSEQVVLSGYADGPQQVKWAISKVG